MAIGVLFEALLLGDERGGGGKPPPKDEAGVKEWVRNKLKAFARLAGRLATEVDEALPGIIGPILRWVINKAAGVAGVCISKPMGFGRRYWKIALNLHGYQEVRIILL